MRSYRIVLAEIVVLLGLASNGLADFTGVTIEQNTDPVATDAGLYVCDFYAHFDNLSDLALAVGFADVVSTNGAFYQHGMGLDTAPLEALIMDNPLLPFDSFVTIGVEFNDGTDGTALTPDFDSTAFNTAGQLFGDWYNQPPTNGQGVPDAEGKVLIARLTLDNPLGGDSITGLMTVGWQPAGSMDYMVADVPIEHVVPSECLTDLTGDGQTNAADLAQLLGSWGPNPGHPADFNDDGQINAADLAQLLGNWGACN